ncbi:HAD family hydrolase [Kribbella sp. NPDC058245]|uniref:HAD family hydrolase n=1 Tax=Kribbella sp. NPDC058245 TaxID=3346399 RepID=UPI0036E7C43C
MRIIVDRDGTILDYAEMFYQFCSDLYRDAAQKPPPQAEINAPAYWASVWSGLRIGTKQVSDHVDEVVRRYLPHHGVLYDGVATAAAVLRERGYTLDLISGWVGSAETGTLLEELGIRELFDRVRTRDDLPGDDAGPVPDGAAKYRLALEGGAYRAEDFAFVVGDSSSDVDLARQLGVPCYLVGTGNGPTTSLAPDEDAFVTRVESFAALVSRPRLGEQRAGVREP